MTRQRHYATTTEAWKDIFADEMTYKAAIAIPMSKGLYRPERHKSAPDPCEHSESDLTTLAWLQRSLRVGLRYTDLTGTRPMDIEPPLFGEMEGIHGLIGMKRLKDVYGSQVFVLCSDTADFWFDCRGLGEAAIKELFPPGKRIALGIDRIIQRFLEAWEFKVTSVVRPVFKDKVWRHHIFFFPLPNQAIGKGNWEDGSLRWVATGEGLFLTPDKLKSYENGYSEFRLDIIHNRIKRTLRGLS